VTAIPLPDTGIVNVGLVAVDVTVRFPLIAPAAVGANLTVNVALCPPLSVNGVVIPLTLIPVPVIPTWETEMLDPPVLVMVSESDPVLPTFTLPKLRLVGLALRAPGDTPVPDTLMVRLGLEALDVMVTVPVAFPLAFGVNVTVNVLLWDAPSETGVDIPVIEKAELFTET
jgi:hypothetical protein